MAGSEAWASLLRHLPVALLVVFRIGGMAIMAPVLSSTSVPVRVRVLLVFVLGLAAYATLPVIAPMEVSLASLPVLVGLELLAGFVIGWGARLPLVAAQGGGLLMGQQMGLGFAQVVSPTADGDQDLVGQLMFYVALAAFLTMGGLEHTVDAVLRTFAHVPLGGVACGPGLVELATGLLLASFEIALRIAAPVLALVFLESITVGYLAKTVPQLNVLSLGFPIRILIGFATIMIAIDVFDDVLRDHIADVFDAVSAWVHEGASHDG